jgi:hypothetical protein
MTLNVKINYRRVWQISLAMAVLVFFIGIAIDHTDVRRYATQMESLMAKGDYQGALAVGERSDKTDQRLLNLRIKALAHENQLGERLFSYPIKGSGRHLITRKGDYELCGYLIDKQLDRFAAALPHYYNIGEQRLPRYYREALVLYNHLRSNPHIVYHNNVLDTDYRDMRELARRYSDPKARQMAVFSNYEDTYWYYYDYLNKGK